MNTKLMQIIDMTHGTPKSERECWSEYFRLMDSHYETEWFKSGMTRLTTMAGDEFDAIASLAKDEHPTLISHETENFMSVQSILTDMKMGRIALREKKSNPYDSLDNESELLYDEPPIHHKVNSARNKRRAHIIRDKRKHGLPKYYSKLNFGRNDTYNTKHNWSHNHWLDIELSSL